MKNKKTSITKIWLDARQQLKEQKFEVAEQTLDSGVLFLAQSSLNGIGDKDLIEGVKKETWHERFWISIEKYIWTRRPDYETVWKFK
jgi:hypothetical protein